MVVLAATAVSWYRGVPERAAPIRSLAILPFDNLSGDTAQDYFADGMTDALITELGKIKALQVISRQSMAHYKGTKKTVPQIAGELKVAAVVEGSVVLAGNHVRVSVQLTKQPRNAICGLTAMTESCRTP